MSSHEFFSFLNPTVCVCVYMCVGQNVLSPIETHNGHTVIISTTALVTIIHVIFAYTVVVTKVNAAGENIFYIHYLGTWNSDVWLIMSRLHTTGMDLYTCRVCVKSEMLRSISKYLIWRISYYIMSIWNMYSLVSWDKFLYN